MGIVLKIFYRRLLQSKGCMVVSFIRKLKEDRARFDKLSKTEDNCCGGNKEKKICNMPMTDMMIKQHHIGNYRRKCCNEKQIRRVLS